MIKDQEALEYHQMGRKGKIEVIPTKPCTTQRDLSLAYSPGVAIPCLHIEKNPDDAFLYTAKGNLVAVVSNGTAVLGLGDIGALGGKPVMEGKGVLFKRFADIDVFDIELDTHNADEIIKTVQLLEPTFGGINLEDIKAPECFYIEEELKKTMKIPVFHDDQHGTAIISGAALMNAMELLGKPLDKIKVVVNGAGASGIACANFYISLGVKKENLILCDTKGAIYKGRTAGMNPYKEALANDTKARTLADALVDADVFAGLSVADCVTQDMVRSMGKNPLIMAMANPDPEITYDLAMAARPDVIMGTGRSDYPNQINNVLGFPFIFRGALDVRATAINEEMKRAAAFALAALAKEDVPDSVSKAYGNQRMRFGKDYLIPKPFDYRVLIWEAAAVAKAAMDSGVARIKIDIEEYKEQLENRLGKSREVMRTMMNRAKRDPKRVVFPEGYNEKVLRASHIVLDEGIAHPILLGEEIKIRSLAKELDVDLDGIQILNPETSKRFISYTEEYYELRQRKGVNLNEARQDMHDRTHYAAMMVRMNDADAMIAGLDQHYPETLRPALQIIQRAEGISSVSSAYMLIIKDKIYFCADSTVNIMPTAEELAEIAIMSAEVAKRFNIEPRVAMVSFSNFGSVKHADTDRIAQALKIARKRVPELMIDGEMQADTAVVPEIIDEFYPFSTLKGGANVLIFPDLQSANASVKLLQRLGGAEAIGPILMGMRNPVHLLQKGCEVNDIVNMTAIAVVEAQEKK
ncbi:phosphate acetyltransferase [bacterium]|nr:MAG: phosphate acetyltransferase [bacterium]